jgi:thioredoxin-like negative regulator of GroEL
MNKKKPELAAQFKVRSSALFYFKNGEVVGTQNGVQSKSVIKSHLNSILKIKIKKYKISSISIIICKSNINYLTQGSM